MSLPLGPWPEGSPSATGAPLANARGTRRPAPAGLEGRTGRQPAGSRDELGPPVTTSEVALSPEVGPASTSSPDRPVDSESPIRRWFRLRVIGAVVLEVWLIALGAYSTTLYHRGCLAEDFATYNQAWTLIGPGHLNP